MNLSRNTLVGAALGAFDTIAIPTQQIDSDLVGQGALITFTALGASIGIFVSDQKCSVKTAFGYAAFMGASVLIGAICMNIGTSVIALLNDLPMDRAINMATEAVRPGAFLGLELSTLALYLRVLRQQQNSAPPPAIAPSYA